MAKLPDLFGRGVLASRPAAGIAGRHYHATDSTPPTTYRDNGSSWDAEATAGLGDHGTVTYLDYTVAAAPADPSAGALRLYAKTGGHMAQRDSSGVETLLDATGGGGGGGGAGYALDAVAMNGTYGDHFTGGALGGLWTRRNFTSGAESYALGPAATFMRVALAGRAAGDGYLQASTADGTYAMKFIPRNGPLALGLALIDSAGTGVLLQYYLGSPAAFNLENITTYSTYAGTYVEAGYNGSSPNVPLFSTDPTSNGRPIWLAIRKAGGSCYASYSLDGDLFSPESSALAWAGTLNRVGFLLPPLGDVDGANGQGFIDLDWFNKIA